LPFSSDLLVQATFHLSDYFVSQIHPLSAKALAGGFQSFYIDRYRKELLWGCKVRYFTFKWSNLFTAIVKPLLKLAPTDPNNPGTLPVARIFLCLHLLLPQARLS
jgi:hypothetical protein